VASSDRHPASLLGPDIASLLKARGDGKATRRAATTSPSSRTRSLRPARVDDSPQRSSELAELENPLGAPRGGPEAVSRLDRRPFLRGERPLRIPARARHAATGPAEDRRP